MKAKIINSTITKNQEGLITKENVLIAWVSKTGHGEMTFKSTADGKYVVDTEYMDFPHIISVIKALKD